MKQGDRTGLQWQCIPEQRPHSWTLSEGLRNPKRKIDFEAHCEGCLTCFIQRSDSLGQRGSELLQRAWTCGLPASSPTETCVAGKLLQYVAVVACEQRTGRDLNDNIRGRYFVLRKVGGISRSGLEMACAGKSSQAPENSKKNGAALSAVVVAHCSDIHGARTRCVIDAHHPFSLK